MWSFILLFWKPSALLPIFSNLKNLVKSPVHRICSLLPLSEFLYLLSYLPLFTPAPWCLPQRCSENCYSQVIILFVRLHSAVNVLGIPPYSLLTQLQSSFNCQSQNITEGEKGNWDKDKERRRHRATENVLEKQQRGCERGTIYCSYTVWAGNRQKEENNSQRILLASEADGLMKI